MELRNETAPELIVPLRCTCGNKDDIGVLAPPCSNDCGRRMELDTLSKEDKEHIRTVVGFVYGWWPGLEDGINGWGDEGALSREPPIVAARALMEKLPWLKERRK